MILHEYGHAMQDSQMTPFGFGTTVEAGSIGEGFGDYWAVDVSNVVAPTPDAACVADWDSVSYTSTVPHCLRRVDRDLHYPEDLNGEVHHDGQIWSRALWDIRKQLGHVRADTIILEAQFGFDPGTSMPDAARATVAAAQGIYETIPPLQLPCRQPSRRAASCPDAGQVPLGISALPECSGVQDYVD